MARTSNTMLNKNGKTGHRCVIPNLRGNAFSFSLLGLMLVMGLSPTLFIMLRCSLCISFMMYSAFKLNKQGDNI